MERPTILVVDDEQDVLDLVAAVLATAGYAIDTATNGAEALALVRTREYDAVVLDVSMPELDGWTVLETMKADPAPGVNEVPVVMLTAMGTTADRLRGGLDGALHYITKPFDVSELLAVMDDVFVPGAPPEPVRRKAVQQATLEKVVRLEQGGTAPGASGPKVHLSRR